MNYNLKEIVTTLKTDLRVINAKRGIIELTNKGYCTYIVDFAGEILKFRPYWKGDRK